MNQDLTIGITKNQIMQILSNSNLPISVIALLMENITREIQNAANVAFERAYQNVQNKSQTTVTAQKEDNKELKEEE